MRIWTRVYNPWTMGGPVSRIISTDVEPIEGPFDLGKGHKGYLVFGPTQRSFIVEAMTGGIVGTKRDVVRADVADGDPEFMEKQLAEAKLDAEKAERLEPAAFWALVR